MKIPRHWLASFFSGILFSALVALLTLAGCAVLPSSSTMNDQPINEFNETLAGLADSTSRSGAAGSDKKGLKQWKDLLSDLSAENVQGKASEVYAEKTFFNDTLKTLRSGEAVEEYLLETAELLESGSVEYRDTVRSEDGSYYVRWEMVYRGKKLAGGKPIRTIGMSQLRFDSDGRVVFHQDFWDSTRGIFEHIPIVGSQVKFIKKRL